MPAEEQPGAVAAPPRRRRVASIAIAACGAVLFEGAFLSLAFPNRLPLPPALVPSMATASAALSVGAVMILAGAILRPR